MKKAISILLILAIISSLSISASALENDTSDPVFVQQINELFTDNCVVEIHDYEGNLIEDGLSTIYTLYLNGNYDEISNYLQENQYYIEKSTLIQPRAYHRVNVYREFTGTCADPVHSSGKPLKWKISFTSAYTYNGNTYEITQADPGRIELLEADWGDNFSRIDIYSERPFDPVISNTDSTITFRYQYGLTAVAVNTDQYGPLPHNVYLGPFTISFVEQF